MSRSSRNNGSYSDSGPDLEDGGATGQANGDGFSDEGSNSSNNNGNSNGNGNSNNNNNNGNNNNNNNEGVTENAGLMRNRGGGLMGSRRGVYESVATNNANANANSYSPQSTGSSGRCILFGCASFFCQTVVVVTAMLLIGTAGFLIGSAKPDLLIATLNSTTGIDLTSVGGVAIVGSIDQDVDVETIDITATANNNNNDTAATAGCGDEMVDIEDVMKEKKKKSVTVRYDPSVVLANNIEGGSDNPFNLPPNSANANSLFLTPPHPFSTKSIGNNNDGDDATLPAPVGFLKNPHLVDGRLVFLSEGDAYVTMIAANNGKDQEAMPASKVTTTIGNVGDPKWHPTLPLLAYTATYSGRRDVYLMDLSSTSKIKSPMRLTYWDVGKGGVSGVIGWIKTGDDAENENENEHANALVIKAVSNDASLPDTRLYMIHLSTDATTKSNNNDADAISSSVAVLEIEPIPLAQAVDTARFQKCWYFVRVQQSSHTIRYVGGTAENLWKYCDNENENDNNTEESSSSSQPLFLDDDYKGTSKSPQLYHHADKHHFLFFLSDRGYHYDSDDNDTKSWIPDRMNVWALPLSKNDSNDKSQMTYTTKDLIQITDTSCDFEGRTIQEYSVDVITGNLVVRIGADLYFMSQSDVQSKIDAASRSRIRTRVLEEENNDEDELQKAIEGELSDEEEEEAEVTVDVDEEEEDDDEEEVAAEIVEEDAVNDDESILDEIDDSNATSTFTYTSTSTFTSTTENADEETAEDAPTALSSDSSVAPKEKETKKNETTAKEEQVGDNNKHVTDDKKASSNAKSIKGKLPETVPDTTEENDTSTTVATTDTATNKDATTAATVESEIDAGNSTEPPAKYYYDFQSPELVSRSAAGESNLGEDHYSGQSTELKRLPIVVYSDFQNDQERIVPVDILDHLKFGDVYETITGSTQMLLTLRGQVWVAPVTDDEIPKYKDAGKNLPARRYRVAPGAMMGGATRILAAMHVPNPVEDDSSDRRLAVILATDPLTSTAEHAFYLIETQAGAAPLFVDMKQLPKPFLGGTVSGGSTRDGGLGSVKVDTLAMSPCGNRMAWSDTDGRIVVMNLPQYQELLGDDEADKTPVKFVVLPKKNELDEPMIGDDVTLNFSPGGRYLTIGHHAKNRFQIISIADLGDPLREENKIAEIALGRIVQATPSKFNSVSPYWGKTPTDIHDLAQNKIMSKLFSVDEPDDVATTLYFLSDRDIKTDVSSPWGYRQRMPHFADSFAVYVLPFDPKDVDESSRGQFRGGGVEELQVDTLLERMDLIQALLDEKTTAASTTGRREKRKLADSIHPLAGAFGFAQKAFETRKRRQLDEDSSKDRDDDDDEKQNASDDHLKEAVFEKDMDIDFGAVDLTFAHTAYRLSTIPAGDYDRIVCQNPDGSLLLIEDGHLAVFQAEGFPSDGYESKNFMPTGRRISSFGMSTNRKFLFLVFAPDGAVRVVPNTAAGTSGLLADLVLDDDVVDKDGMHLSIWPSLEYRQLYDDAWRMLRDYFYDPDMTGLDWPGIHERFLPLVERCSRREELDDVLIQMASELSALHVFVYGGEYNSPIHGDTELSYVNEVGSLGAILKRTPAWKGYTVMSIPEADPDFTKIDQASMIYSPLSNQSLRLSGQRGLQVGDVIVGVNGESVMTVPDIHMLLRGTAGRSVRLDVLRLASGTATEAGATNETRKLNAEEATVESLITVPLSPGANSDLLYHAWEWKTEQMAEKLAAEAGISVGYVHLQDMSGASAEDAFARGYFPNYHKQGFILDVRHNRGGNIDSWVLDVLQRKAWMYWQSRDFDPETGGIGWDEHYAFRGHLIVLVDEKTSSDGEGVSRGISELGLGKIIGKRTWGGGIWLASDNRLVDGGIATAPEIGDYNENFSWGMGIEQMGLEPDIVVDNDPHETYKGKDRQLERAIEELKKWIDEEPVVVPKPKTKRKDVTMGERECKAK